MKATGIIIEYNPFTKGHLHHLKETKKLTDPDIIIGVLSSSFVQRGEPSIISKEERVKIALDAGVDIVVELPFIYTVENADFFAFGAVSLLNDLHATTLVFGSETGETETFLKKYDACSIVQPHLDFLIKDYLDKGYSYPSSMSLALKEIDAFQLESPNDILGYSYKRIIDKYKYPLKIETILRETDYKDDDLKKKYPSASALRKALKENKDISSFSPYSSFSYLNYLDNYFNILKDILILSSYKDLGQIHLVDEGIEYLFKKQIIISSSMEEFINNCTSKRYTSARIKRTIIHILLRINKQIAKDILKDKPPYIRILGINKKGEQYLKEKKKEITIPILNRFEGKKYPLLNLERNATYLYFINTPYKNKEYEKELYIYPIRKE